MESGTDLPFLLTEKAITLPCANSKKNAAHIFYKHCLYAKRTLQATPAGFVLFSYFKLSHYIHHIACDGTKVAKVKSELIV